MSNDQEIPNTEVEKPAFDYEQLRDDTVLPVAKSVLKIIAENVDLIIYSDKIDEDTKSKNLAEVSTKIIDLLVEGNVQECNMQFLIDKCMASIEDTFTIIAKQKATFQTELMAITLGSNDPGTGNPSKAFATFSHLIVAFNKAREEYNNKK